MKTAAIILNIFLPPIGSFVIKKFGQGIAQLILVIIGWFFVFTAIGAFIGAPLLLIAWIWGLITVFSYKP